MDVWTFLGGLTMGAAAAAIYDMSSGPQPMAGGQLQGIGKEGAMFNGTFRGKLQMRVDGQAQQPVAIPPKTQHQRPAPAPVARQGGFLGQVGLVTGRSTTPGRILMGQNGAPSNGGGTPAPSPAPGSQQPGPSFSRQFGTQDGFGFPVVTYPTFPGYIPPPAPSGRLTCKKIVNDDTGEETLECEPKPEPVVPTYRYPTVYLNPMFF